MNALDLLIADHNRFRGMFSRFRAAHAAADAETMIELAGKVFEDLEVHTTIEEDIFYPAVHDLEQEIGETVDEGIQEHHVVKVLMEELGQVEPASVEWWAKMMVLIENVEHHAEEETSLFPPVRSAMDAVALEEMGAQFEQMKVKFGAPVLADKIDFTNQDLMDLASQQEIPGRSKMSHEELAATVAPA